MLSKRTMTIQNLLFRVDHDALFLPTRAPVRPWTTAEALRFVDSLYREYPLGIFVFAAATEDRRHEMVVDGAQRLAAVYSAIRGRAPRFNGEHVGLALQTCFHVADEKFANFDERMAEDPAWIHLPEFFATGEDAVGVACSRLLRCGESPEALAASAMRLQKLAAILARCVSVEYMPPNATLEDCAHVRQLLNGSSVAR